MFYPQANGFTNRKRKKNEGKMKTKERALKVLDKCLLSFEFFPLLFRSCFLFYFPPFFMLCFCIAGSATCMTPLKNRNVNKQSYCEKLERRSHYLMLKAKQHYFFLLQDYISER